MSQRQARFHWPTMRETRVSPTSAQMPSQVALDCAASSLLSATVAAEPELVVLLSIVLSSEAMYSSRSDSTLHKFSLISPVAQLVVHVGTVAEYAEGITTAKITQTVAIAASCSRRRVQFCTRPKFSAPGCKHPQRATPGRREATVAHSGSTIYIISNEQGKVNHFSADFCNFLEVCPRVCLAWAQNRRRRAQVTATLNHYQSRDFLRKSHIGPGKASGPFIPRLSDCT